MRPHKPSKRYTKKAAPSRPTPPSDIDILVSKIKYKVQKLHDLYKVDLKNHEQINKLELQIHNLISSINSYPQKARSIKKLDSSHDPINPYLVPVANRDFIQIKLIEILVLLNHAYEEINKKDKHAANLLIDHSNQIQRLIKRFGSIGVYIIIPADHI